MTATPSEQTSTHAQESHTESGFTLVELVIYMVLSVVVLGIVGGLLIQGLESESTVRGVTAATNDAQLAARALQADTRNAQAASVLVRHDDRILQLRVESSNTYGQSTCTTWYYSSVLDELRMKQGASAVSPPAVALPDAAISIPLPAGEAEAEVKRDAARAEFESANWVLFASNVTADGEIFTTTGFSSGGGSISARFTVDAGSIDPVVINSSASSRAPTGDSATCF